MSFGHLEFPADLEKGQNTLYSSKYVVRGHVVDVGGFGRIWLSWSPRVEGDRMAVKIAHAPMRLIQLSQKVILPFKYQQDSIHL